MSLGVNPPRGLNLYRAYIMKQTIRGWDNLPPSPPPTLAYTEEISIENKMFSYWSIIMDVILTEYSLKNILN
jgi:hypothetical protein